MCIRDRRRVHGDNLWRYDHLFQSLQKLTAKDEAFLAKDTGLYFGSVKGTLAHLLLADYLWYMRFHSKTAEGLKIPLTNQKTAPFAPAKLVYADCSTLWSANDAQPWEKFFPEKDPKTWLDGLHGRMDDLQHAWLSYLSSAHCTEEALNEYFVYLNTKGKEFKKRRGLILSHLINHHTHHIGQITTVISSVERSLTPSIDYTYYLDEYPQ
eukprot:TRINITY_DN11322_c0_g1_i1.p1 TRINITY_DN11322_c0_g1~~TRINITY_DN11322_c0_g1_i1.p1  ORF type:complete len:210 (-),score=31.44 TRINITY_DN11322_c0_g1_i1:181-810(-)